MSKPVASSLNPQQVVEEFIALMNAMNVDAACELLAADVDYRNMPMAPIKGRDAAREFLKMEGVVEIDWENLHVAANGNVVLTERVDRFVFEDGKRLEIAVMGTFHVDSGQITQWRDYFDLEEVKRQQSA